MFQEAQQQLDDEVAASKHDRRQWYMDQFQSRGTTSDKIASAAVKLSGNDFMLSLDSFNVLFDAARHDTHHFEAALKALVAVWPRLLPARPLKRFVAQYFGTLPTAESDSAARKKVLLYWYIEDMLKRTYTQFLALCETMLRDRLAVRRECWLDGVGKLLLTVAEQKHVIMSMLVDKMGDPSGQIAHKAYHQLLAMLCESSTNQALLLPELERIAFMKNCPPRALRLCVNVLNQFVFSKDERKLAAKCVSTYLALFRQLVLSEALEQSVTTALVIGMKRAFPYSGSDVSHLSEHLDALFILSNTGHFIQRVSAVSLLHQLFTKQSPQAFVDRWYRALYHLLLVPPKQIPQAAFLTGFFSTLHKALRSDTNHERVAAFVHRILDRSLLHSEAFVCAALQLVSELARATPLVRGLIRPAPGASAKQGLQAKATPTSLAAGGMERLHYDPKHRDPQYSHASSSCAWTLNILAKHTHPTVVKLAVLLLFGEEAVSDTHPLDDLTLRNFLQMFADAKPTAASADAEDGRRNSDKGVPVFRRGQHIPVLPSAADPSFISANPAHVDVGAIFVHKYAVQRQRFLDGLSQSKSGWADSLLLETDVAPLVSHVDSLFGPAAASKSAGRKRDREDAAAEDESGEEAGDEELSENNDDDGDDDGDDAVSWGGEDDDDDDLDDEEEEEGLGKSSAAAPMEDLDGDDFNTLIERNKKYDDSFSGDRRPFGGRGHAGFSRGRGRGSASLQRGGRRN